MPKKPLPSRPSIAPLSDCYLATFDAEAPAELARLAAAMAGAPGAFDAGALFRRALALREGAVGAITGRRAALLTEADAEALTMLDDALKGRGIAQQDPPRVAIRHEIQRRHREARTPEREVEQRAWQDILRAVAAESGIPCPALPCLRNDALRWVLTAPEAMPWEAVERYFLDYLSAHSQELRGLTLVGFMERHWSADRECDAQALSELATGFRRFWQENDCAGRFVAAAAVEADKSRRRAISGSKANKRKGRATGERNKWLSFCRDFKQSTGGKHPDAENVDAFLAGRKGTSRTKKRQREFLQTMLQARRHGSVRVSLHEPLAKCGIHLPADAVRDCYDMIFGK